MAWRFSTEVSRLVKSGVEIPLEAPFSDGGQAVALDVAARNSVDEVLPRTYLLGLAEVREEAIAPVVGVAWVALQHSVSV